MGSSESRKETETNQNNVYLPNLLARQIIGDIEVNNGEKDDKKNCDTSSIDKKSSNNQEELIMKDNTSNEKNTINKTKPIDRKKKKKTIGHNIFSDVNKGQYFNNQNLFIAQTADAIKMEITNQKKDIYFAFFTFLL